VIAPRVVRYADLSRLEQRAYQVGKAAAGTDQHAPPKWLTSPSERLLWFAGRRDQEAAFEAALAARTKQLALELADVAQGALPGLEA
jgi:hypothetical protein